MKIVVLVAIIVLSVAAQATSARVFDLTSANIDLPLVVVVLASLSGGPIVGLWAGTFAGFLQDVMSGGLVGVSGLAKSLVGVTIGGGGDATNVYRAMVSIAFNRPCNDYECRVVCWCLSTYFIRGSCS